MFSQGNHYGRRPPIGNIALNQMFLEGFELNAFIIGRLPSMGVYWPTSYMEHHQTTCFISKVEANLSLERDYLASHSLLLLVVQPF